MPKTVLYKKKKYHKVLKPVRAENDLIFFHTGLFSAYMYIALKRLPLKLIVDLHETVRFEGYQYRNYW